MMNEHEVSIVNAVLEQVRLKSNMLYGVKISDSAKAEISKFLGSQELNNEGVQVVFTLKDSEEGYTSTVISSNDYKLNLSYGKNNRPGKYSNVLFVSITKTPEAKFRAFWENRNLPVSLLEEVIGKVDLGRPVEIQVFEKAADWNKRRKAETHPYIFIGQKIHLESGSFIPNKPIAYYLTEGNFLVLTSPNEKLKNGRAHYTFK